MTEIKPISISAPKKNEDISAYRTQVEASGKTVAAIDFNGDGKFNYGKQYGDTIKIFDWDAKTATGHHLVKSGEISVGANAGEVDTTTVPLGKSLLKTFKGLSQKEISAKCPGAILVNPDNKDKFEEGSTIMIKSSDGSRHNIHYVKNGELPATTLKMTGATSDTDVKSDKGIMAGSVVWADIPAKK